MSRFRCVLACISAGCEETENSTDWLFNTGLTLTAEILKLVVNRDVLNLNLPIPSDGVSHSNEQQTRLTGKRLEQTCANIAKQAAMT